jgi:dihydropteroate synthase
MIGRKMVGPRTSAVSAWRTISCPPGHPTSPADLPLDRPRFLGILNCTPDSFSDGGLLPSVLAAVDRARITLAQGADALDIGGESTRPGAHPVPPDEQIKRIVPVITAIRAQLGHTFLISADTTSAQVAAAALDAGANAINDVSAGQDDTAMLDLAAERACGIILMHRLTRPARDSYSDQYGTGVNPSTPEYPGGIVPSVRAFLHDRAAAAVRAGVDPRSVILDPGLGFGKSVEQNLELIEKTGELASLGFPILSGISRKSFVGRASGLGPDSIPADRLAGSIALSVLHYLAGARLFRVHDVGAHAQAIRAAVAAGPWHVHTPA